MRNPFAKRPLPYGEPGSIEYWTEALKRAYQLGEPRALAEIERLGQITGMHPPIDFIEVGRPWFGNLWANHLAPFADKKFNHLRMPY